MLSILGWLIWRGLLISFASFGGIALILLGDFIGALPQVEPSESTETGPRAIPESSADGVDGGTARTDHCVMASFGVNPTERLMSESNSALTAAGSS